jgi:putative ABC transport system permease protein
VANAARAFVDGKQASIATLKSVGAPGSQVVALYLIQVMLIAAISTVLGLAVGAALPFLLDIALRDQLPLPLNPEIAAR